MRIILSDQARMTISGAGFDPAMFLRKATPILMEIAEDSEMLNVLVPLVMFDESWLVGLQQSSMGAVISQVSRHYEVRRRH